MKFKDPNGRSIEITSDEGMDIEAFHNGKRVGSLEFVERDDVTSLIGMGVDIAYQRVGIGTMMMKMAAEIHGKSFDKPSFNAVGGSKARSDSYYTQDGSALIRHCIQKGILADTEQHEVDDNNE